MSHQKIYRSVFLQARGLLKQQWLRHLGSKRPPRRGRWATRIGHHRGQIVGAVSIRAPSAKAADHAVPGHGEGDVLAGGQHGPIITWSNANRGTRS